MPFKYTIIQENTITKAKLMYEFSAADENEMVDEFNSFMSSIGLDQSGFLKLVDEDSNDLFSNLEREVDESYINKEVEGYKNFEFVDPYTSEGDGQKDYNYDLEEATKQDIQSTWPFPMDRPSQPTIRIDSSKEDEDNLYVYYGT